MRIHDTACPSSHVAIALTNPTPMRSKLKLPAISMKTSKIAYVALAALLAAAADLNAATVIALTADTGNSTAGAFGGLVTGTVNQTTFAYDPLTLGTPLPDQVFDGNNDGYHGNLTTGTHTLSYTLTDGPYTITIENPVIVFDFFGRRGEAGAVGRDDNYTVTLYNGDYSTMISQIAGQGVSGSTNDPNYNRTSFNLPEGVTFDRVQITTPAGTSDSQRYFTVMEVRLAAIPEPSAALLGGLGLLALLRRRRA